MAIGPTDNPKDAREKLPDAEFGSLKPFMEELEWLEELISSHRLTDENCTRAKALELTRNRLRERIWEAVDVRQKKSPDEIGRLVEVHPDTVRYWCRQGYVEFEQTKGGHYRVYVDSALDHVRSN